MKTHAVCALAIAIGVARSAAADVTTFREGPLGFEAYASAGAGWEANVNESADGSVAERAPFGRISGGLRSRLAPIGLEGMLRAERTDYAGSDAFDSDLLEVATPLRIPVAPFVSLRVTPWAASRAYAGSDRDSFDTGVGGGLQFDALLLLRARAGVSYVDRDANDVRFSHWRRGVFAHGQTRLPGRLWLGVDWISQRGTGVARVDSWPGEYRKGEIAEEQFFVDVERALSRHVAIRGGWSRSRVTGDVRREQTEVVLALAGTF